MHVVKEFPELWCLNTCYVLECDSKLLFGCLL